MTTVKGLSSIQNTSIPLDEQLSRALSAPDVANKLMGLEQRFGLRPVADALAQLSPAQQEHVALELKGALAQAQKDLGSTNPQVKSNAERMIAMGTALAAKAGLRVMTAEATTTLTESRRADAEVVQATRERVQRTPDRLLRDIQDPLQFSQPIDTTVSPKRAVLGLNLSTQLSRVTDNVLNGNNLRANVTAQRTDHFRMEITSDRGSTELSIDLGGKFPWVTMQGVQAASAAQKRTSVGLGDEFNGTHSAATQQNLATVAKMLRASSDPAAQDMLKKLFPEP